MDLSLYTWIALGVIGAAIGIAASGRLTAAGVLLGANVIVFLLSLSADRVGAPLGAPPALGKGYDAVTAQLALYAPALWRHEPWSGVQLFTSMFVHADFLHLLGNSLALAFFGLPFEQRVGPRRFLAIYLLTGLFAAGAEMITIGHRDALLMGASGAIFGILGAFAARYPFQIIAVPVPLPIMFILRMPVLAGAAIYAAFQLVYAYFSLQNGPDGVAYFAHLGGLVAGILLAPILVPRRGDRPRARVDLDRFTPFARTDQAKTILEAMRKNHDEPAVFQAWLEKFLHAAQCPTCSSKVMPHGEGRLRCAQRHEFDVRQA